MPSEILENDFMFSGRGIVPWHEIGVVLDGVLTSEEAIKAAKLTWTVEQSPVYTAANWASAIPGYVANVRSDTKEVAATSLPTVLSLTATAWPKTRMSSLSRTRLSGTTR
jgi:hypothetical protein